jgi:hypothetical protein
MSKRWTVEEDLFLVSFFESIGAWIGPHDLGRSEKSTIKRVQNLKEWGAWEEYREADYHRKRALVLAKHSKRLV